MLNKKAVFLLDSQPPNLGELITVLNKMRNYSPLYICLNQNTKVMPLPFVISTWVFILQNISKEKPLILTRNLEDFKSMSKLPPGDEFKNCTILTTDKEIFIHLSSINISVELVPHVLGYHGVFLRSAYRQGRVLDYLLGE